MKDDGPASAGSSSFSGRDRHAGVMAVFAHAGHWLVSLAYLAPLVFLVGVIAVGKIRDRRAGTDDERE